MSALLDVIPDALRALSSLAGLAAGNEDRLAIRTIKRCQKSIIKLDRVIKRHNEGKRTNITMKTAERMAQEHFDTIDIMQQRLSTPKLFRNPVSDEE